MAMAIDSRHSRRPGFLPPAAMARIAERARLFRAAQRHSLLVRLLRVLLPVAVIGVMGGYLATVAFNTTLLPKIKIDGIVITADDLTMKDPSFADTTSDGRYEVRAKRAIVGFGQKKETPVRLVDVSGELIKKSGEITALKAKHGLFDNAKGYLELLDGIEIDGSSGLMARLTRAMIHTKEGKIVSVDPVSANMPAGSVQAASMTMNTKTKLVELRGGVTVRLIPQKEQTLAAGKDSRHPVDVRAEELDIDDASKTAHFRGEVVAIQGETMLQTPSLKIKYEGKAASALGGGAGSDKDAARQPQGGTRVTFLWARDGVEITAGNDRKITSDLADFDVTAETALFDGNVVAVQEKNLLKGGRLTIDKKSGKTRMETPGGGRILASFVPPANTTLKAAKRPAPGDVAREALMGGGFKADRTAPMVVEATTLELLETANKAIFSGNVTARQGEMTLRTSQLTAFFSGKAGLGLSEPTPDADVAPPAPVAGKGKGKAKAEKTEITRLEARQTVIVGSGEQSATAKWADFDVKANTALLGGGVTVDKIVPHPTKAGEKAVDVVTGDRLRLDLTTGVFQFESDPDKAVSAVAPPKTDGPVTSPRTGCAEGRTCGVFYPNQIKQKAMDALKKKAPAVEGN
jgi:lipopolysaccharide export system protein LptA